jgi:hypothetical protein
MGRCVSFCVSLILTSDDGRVLRRPEGPQSAPSCRRGAPEASGCTRRHFRAQQGRCPGGAANLLPLRVSDETRASEEGLDLWPVRGPLGDSSPGNDTERAKENNPIAASLCLGIESRIPRMSVVSGDQMRPQAMHNAKCVVVTLSLLLLPLLFSDCVLGADTNEALHQRILAGDQLSLNPSDPEGARTIDAKWLREAALKHVRVEIYNAVIQGPIDADGVTFEQGLLLDGCIVKDRADFSHALFKRDFNALDIVFSSGVSFQGAVFERAVSFARARFEGAPILFDDAHFLGAFAAESAKFGSGIKNSGTVIFTHVRFDGMVDFAGSSFDADVQFISAQFGGQGFFPGVRFENTADFERAHFADITTFGSGPTPADKKFNAIFVGRALFGETQFDSRVNFDDVTFRGDASFANTRFSSDALFSQTIFAAIAMFNSAQFGGQGFFPGAKFENTANFQRAHFADITTFGSGPANKELNATFAGKAFFDEAQFDSRTQFDGVTFGGDAYFVDTRFGSEAQFRETIFAASGVFSLAKFSGLSSFLGADFKADAQFLDTEIGDDVYFVGATFEGGVIFDRAQITASANLQPAHFLHNASFAGARFGSGARFIGVKFGEGVDFGGAHFENDAHFEDSVFAGRSSFRSATFRVVYFSDTETAGAQQFKNDVDLLGCTYDHIQVEWRSLLQYPDGRSRIQPYDRQPYIELENVLRNSGSNEDADAVYAERRRAENQKLTRLGRAGDWTYWLFANYGIDLSHEFGLTVFVLGIGAWIFARPGAAKTGTDEHNKKTTISPYQAFFLAARQFLPFELPVKSHWTPSRGMASVYANFLHIVGWILIPLAAAWFAGFLRHGA